MKNILVLIHDDPGQASRLQASFDLARALHGHLICLDLTIPNFVPPDRVFPSDSMVLGIEPDTANRERIRRKVKAQGIGFDWIERADTLDNAIAEIGPSADIIVLSAPGDVPLPDMGSAVGKALTVAHKAVLVVPKGAPGFRAAGEAMIAWDGSRQAVAALHAALPLLRHARNVTIVEIDDGSLKTPASEAKNYLAQRYIDATVRHDLAFGEKAGWLLVEQIGLLDVDYVVMGGFGHPRIVEDIFGGATHRLLRETPVPLFLKH